ncbi:MAG: hypothetical protein GEV08_22585, partial [Acidimicrobiia bacterium]|nr:hypothetical protein [Acidimicrobiia bacterium]
MDMASTSALQELSHAARAVVAAAGPATVAIGRDGRGSGTVLAEGKILTNAHNLRDRTTQVTFADGRVAQAEVVGADLDGDLAVLAVDTAGIAPLEWASDEVDQGDWVFTLAAGGPRGPRVTTGMVSGRDRAFRGPRGRRVRGSIEHTAPLARGSSGGALLDAAGRVVGVNTHRVERGFYLALPTDADLRRRVDALAAGVTPVRHRLGIALAPGHVAARLRASVGLAPRDGLLVRGVEDGSPAAEAGVRAGDLLVGAAAVDLRTADDLFDAL